MKTEDVVTLVQHYRHDLLNQLQVIAGYVQLKEIGKAEVQIKEVFSDFTEERKLFSLNIPQVILWVLQFSSRFTNYGLSYDIDIENKNLQQHDANILMKLEKIMQNLQKRIRYDLVIDLELEFRDAIDSCIIKMSVNKNNLYDNEEAIENDELEGIEFRSTDEVITFQFQVLY